MASVWVSCLLLCFCIAVAKTDDCVTYNFEHDVDSLFKSDTGICEGLQLSPWNVRSYSEVWIDRPNHKSFSLVSATSSLSCGSTFEFRMVGGGTVELNVYVESNFMSDQISVIAMQAIPGGHDTTVGSFLISASDPNFVNGWQSVKITLIGNGTYQGYISILGMGSANSLVLVDSFRYISPNTDEDLCQIYEGIIETETTTEQGTEASRTSTTPNNATESIIETTTWVPYTKTTTDTTNDPIIETTTRAPYTETPPAGTTTEPITETTSWIPYTETTPIDVPSVEECTKYNFESDFGSRFSTGKYLCNDLLPWQLDNYTSIDTGSPKPESTAFMAPHETASCISSFVFKMEPDGIVEANVFMEPVQELDYIIIIAQRVTGNEFDTVGGFIKYHPGNQVFTPGWNVIRFSILESTSFDGYLIFIGSADKTSTVLVDSIRYIPPLTSPEDASCNVY